MNEEETVTQWQPYLPNLEDERLYLDGCAKEDAGDGRLVLIALRDIARSRNVNMSDLAKEAGISRTMLYKSFAGEARPGFAPVLRIARALGFRLSFGQLPDARQSAAARAKTSGRKRKQPVVKA